MKNYLLEWFKSRKEKKEVVIPTVSNERSLPEITPYKSCKLVNNVLTVVLLDGEVLCKSPATQEDFEKSAISKSKEELFRVFVSEENMKVMEKQKEEKEKYSKLVLGSEILKKLSDFVVEENCVYLKGTNRSIPELLLTEFLEVISGFGEDDSLWQEKANKSSKYQGLKNFFLWCCLNPRAEVADQLYTFLKKNSFRITKQGFFAALRNVVTIDTDENKSFVEFISNTYNKVKAVWKKKPENYSVYTSDDFEGFGIVKTDSISSGDFQSRNNAVIGNLMDLYKKLPTMTQNRYTDAHTHTFDIRVGQVVSMPPEKCNWSTADCAHAGLHFTADEIHYVGCGDTSVLVLINPMTVVGIGASKGRCYEYLPIMTVPREEATVLLHDLDFDVLELDEDYAISQLETLSLKATQGFAAETTKYNFNLPNISSDQIRNVISSLEDMKSLVLKRVVNI